MPARGLYKTVESVRTFEQIGLYDIVYSWRTTRIQNIIKKQIHIYYKLEELLHIPYSHETSLEWDEVRRSII